MLLEQNKSGLLCPSRFGPCLGLEDQGPHLAKRFCLSVASVSQSVCVMCPKHWFGLWVNGGPGSSMWVEEGRGGGGGVGYHSLEESGQVGGASGSLPDLCVQAPCVFSDEAVESQLRSIPVWSLGSAKDAELG